MHSLISRLSLSRSKRIENGCTPNACCPWPTALRRRGHPRRRANRVSGAVNTIGQGPALARGLVTKHATKQVDRLLSNAGIDVDAPLRYWVPHVVGSRTDLKVAMDLSARNRFGEGRLDRFRR
jgi:hypothetical protein